MLKDYYTACKTLVEDSSGNLDTPINDLTNDSREVTPGTLFVAIKGSRCDGRSFIPDAIARGASAVVYQGESSLPFTVPSLRVSNDYAVLARLAEFHFGYPARGMTIIGITGTGGAGKSSLVDEIVRRFSLDFPRKSIAVLSVDPSKRKSGGTFSS